jgi:4-hydroxy-tetrahydrodipicolinate reductase
MKLVVADAVVRRDAAASGFGALALKSEFSAGQIVAEAVMPKEPVIKPRIVLYGPGRFGSGIAARAIEKGWPVLGVYNRAGSKVGKTLGQLCTPARTEQPFSITVQDFDLADLRSIGAQLAIVAANDALRENMPVYRKLMNAGLNILCIGAQANYPMGCDPEAAQEIDELARANGVTFTGGGAWDHCRVWPGILAASACTDIKKLLHTSFTNVGVNKAEMFRDGYGGGMTAEEFEEKIVRKKGRYVDVYKTVLYQVLGALGYTVTSVTERRQPYFYDEPIFCPPLNRMLQPHEAGGMTMVAEADTEEGVTARVEAEFRFAREGEKANFAWLIEGSPTTRVIYERQGGPTEQLSGYVLNRVVDVINAAPGIQDVSKLGMPRHSSFY